MNYFKLKYTKYFIFILLLYILFSILVRIINIYTFLFLIIIIYIFYNFDKKLFKKIVYKVIFKNKKNTLSFKNTYGAAKISLEGVEKINKKISDKVKAELLNYQKNKLESQLKSGDYKVTLFGAGSSGKTSIARSLLKNIVGQTSAKIGTTKQINNYKIILKITAPPIPQKITFFLCSGGNLDATIPIIIALSPAKTKSIRIIWVNSKKKINFLKI